MIEYSRVDLAGVISRISSSFASGDLMGALFLPGISDVAPPLNLYRLSTLHPSTTLNIFREKLNACLLRALGDKSALATLM